MHRPFEQAARSLVRASAWYFMTPMRSLLVGAGVILAAGCGSSNPYETVPARGTIKFADGSSIEAARIDVEFISQAPPVDAATHPRPGIAAVDPQTGEFVVSPYAYGDGLILGRHRVTVVAYDEQRRPLKAIGPEYRQPDTTPLEIEADGAELELRIERR